MGKNLCVVPTRGLHFTLGWLFSGKPPCRCLLLDWSHSIEKTVKYCLREVLIVNVLQAQEKERWRLSIQYAYANEPLHFPLLSIIPWCPPVLSPLPFPCLWGWGSSLIVYSWQGKGSSNCFSDRLSSLSFILLPCLTPASISAPFLAVSDATNSQAFCGFSAVNPVVSWLSSLSV